MAPRTKRTADVHAPLAKKGKKSATNGEATKAKDSKQAADDRKQRKEALNFVTPYYLIKKDPADISIDDIERAPSQTLEWNGVRTMPSLNVLQRMKIGNKALMFQTGKVNQGIVGILQVAGASYVDQSQFNAKSKLADKKAIENGETRWYSIDVQLKHRLPEVLALSDLKEHKDGKLKGLPMFDNQRLMVMPLTKQQWDDTLSLAPGYLEGDEEEGVENEDEEGADGDGEADDKSVSLGGEDESPNAGDEDDA